MMGDGEMTIAWFCVRSQPRHEQIASRHLRHVERLEVFSPRIRFVRPTRHGPVWVTESVFPNYLFVRFDWKTSLPRVHYAPGVSGIVHFGPRWPLIPDAVIDDMRAILGPDDPRVISKDLQPGEQIEIADGLFEGLKAVISQVMPGKDRVTVLMNFLGQQASVELPVTSIVKHVTR